MIAAPALSKAQAGQQPQATLEGVIVRLTSKVNIEVIQEGITDKLRLSYSQVTYANGRLIDQNDLSKDERCQVLLTESKPIARLTRNRHFCQSLLDIEGLPESFARDYYSLFLNHELPMVFCYAVLESIIRLNCAELVERFRYYTADECLHSMAQTALRLANEQYFTWYELEEEVLDNAEHVANLFAQQLTRTKPRQKLVNALHIALELKLSSLGRIHSCNGRKLPCDGTRSCKSAYR